jgi:uncharacterized protein
LWEKIKHRFEKYPSRMDVARKIVEYGLCVKYNGKIYCGDIEINDIALAKAANVDRRTIKATVKIILEDKLLAEIFKNITPAGPFLKNAAKNLGFGVIEIQACATNSGIIASATNIIATTGLGIRQVHAGDPELEENPLFTIITEKSVKGNIINKFLEIEGVKKVSIY